MSAELLEWDTQFWGVRVARVTTETPDFAELDAWAREHGVACLYFLSRDKPGAALAAEEAGFGLRDVRMELARPSDPDERSAVRLARSEDEAALRAIARTNHRITRFYADPFFADDRCDDLYDAWIARSLDGSADAVLVADADGEPAGYVSLHAGADAASIGLIGVKQEKRGRGLGHDLVRGAVRWSAEHGHETVTVATQGRNIAALRTFESCGFRTTDVLLWFHKWYDR